MSRRQVVGLMTALVLTACATPNVKYVAYSQEAPRAAIDGAYETYLLPKSILTIGRSGDEGKYIYPIGLALAADTRNSFGVRAVDRFGVDTDLTVTRIENTALLHSVSVDLVDKRIEYVGDAFKLLGTVATLATGPGIALAGSSAGPYPREVDTLERLTQANCLRLHCEIPLITPVGTDLAATLSVGDVPPDAMDLAQALTKIGDARGVLLSSACRQSSVQIRTGEDTQDTFHFSLADPRYVQVIPLPSKGTITFHSQCGFNVTSEKVEVQSNAAVADAILQDVKKLLESMKEQPITAE